MGNELSGESGTDRRERNSTKDELRQKFESQLKEDGDLEFASYLDSVDSNSIRKELLADLVAIATAHLQSKLIANAWEVILSHNSDLRDELASLLATDRGDEPTTDVHQPTIDFTPSASRGSRRRSRGLRIRCPHCSNHVELLADTPHDSIDCSVCGSTFSLVDRSAATLEAPTLEQIDRFQLVSRLGVGGFGTVWKARDTDLDRIVAVKIPRRGQLSAGEMEQFLREARSAAQLRHSNIVAVHEVGRDGDNLFIVSDLIRGVTLSDWLTGTRCAPREAAALMVIMADALHHAHEQGVIHRDLKPSNIMLDHDNQPHLMDFGLAKREAGEVAMTVDGQILGTPAYMSPEQARGEAHIVDRRTDIYSLGVILFELVAGELPFRGNYQMQVHQRQTEDAPNLRALNHHIPKDLATICAKCLERAPGARYSSAAEVRDVLNRFLRGEPILARPLSRPEVAVRWAQRYPARASLVVLTIFLAIAGPAMAIVLERQRSKLDRQYREINRMYESKVLQDRTIAAATAEQLATIARLSGKAKSWDFWPPATQLPPKRQQLNTLLAHSEPLLLTTISQNTSPPVDRLRSHLALAVMYEAAGRLSDAARQLAAAVELLEGEDENFLRSTEWKLTLAQAYRDLSRLSAESVDEHNDWLRKGAAVQRQLVEESPSDPALLADLLDTEVRLAVTAEAENPSDALERARQLDTKLRPLFPTTVSEAYRLACQLAGRPAMLDEATKGTNDPTEPQ